MILAATTFLALARALHEGGAWTDRVEPFLKAHCVECHSGPEPKGDLAFDAWATEDAARGAPATWDTVRAKLAAGAMPPKGRPRPEPEEVAAVRAWIDASFGPPAAAEAAPRYPRPTLRRLNRVQFQNTIRDLLGVEFDVEATFPADDVGYGFDDIGDVLSMPDSLFEKYADAVERIASRAIVLGDAVERPKRRVDGAALSQGKSSNAREEYRVLFTNGETGLEHAFPREGEYVLRVRAYGDQAGPEPVRLALRLDKRDLERFEVQARSHDEAQALETRFHAGPGNARLAVAFLNDYYQPDAADPAQRDRNLVVEWLELEGPLDPPPIPAWQARELPPGARADVRAITERLARRAWRRPPEKGEIDRLLELARDHAEAGSALRVILQGVLLSPHFLFLVEHDPEGWDPERRHAITPHELAARLSYFLWASLPDAELEAAADDGSLARDDVLAREARRMLDDARASTLSEVFAAQWLQLRNLDRVAPDPVRFPAFDADLRAAMSAESTLFFEALLREARPVRELLTADFTFLNERLAAHYGLSGVRGPHLRRVPVDGRVRGGLLGQASILTVTSNPTRTSPVKRGKWILENLLDAPPPPPPPGVGVLDESQAAARAASQRERLARHREDAACAACHAVLDPLGLGLENFDATGAWRETDEGHPIDAGGELPDGRSFHGPAELRALLAADPAIARCLVKKLAVYALGRGLLASDESQIERLLALYEGRSPPVRDLVVGVVCLEAFRTR